MRLHILAACLFLLLLALASARCISQRAAPADSSSVQRSERDDPYTPRLPERAHAYHRANRILVFAGMGWRVLGLALFLRLGLSAVSRDSADAMTRRIRRGAAVFVETRVRPRAHRFVTVAIYYLFYSVFFTAWSLPIGFAGFLVEHKFGFSNESIPLFFKDQLINLAISWVMIPVVWLGYHIYIRWPRRWWLILWAAMAPISLFVTVVYPAVIAPLYHRYTPLPEGPLRSDLLSLAEKAGIRNASVLVEDTSTRTSHVNAYVTGLGPSARIVLNDTALEELPHDQILAVIGHEMGHYAEYHVLIGAGAGAIGTGLILGLLAMLLPRLAARYGPAFRLRGLNDLAALPLVVLTIYIVGLLGEPVSSAVSRTMEKRADVYGLRITGLNDATARLMVGFAERDLSDPNPPPLLHFWFGTHPTLSERIEFARRFRR